VAAYYLSTFRIVELKAEHGVTTVPRAITGIVWLIDGWDLRANGDDALRRNLVLGKGPPHSRISGGQMRYRNWIFSKAPDVTQSRASELTQGPP
jgi:hypothetical protein